MSNNLKFNFIVLKLTQILFNKLIALFKLILHPLYLLSKLIEFIDILNE